jgi:Protein of unknown function (DUF2897)
VPTAVIVIVVVLALVAGLWMGLRNSAKTGMPSQDVLDRATRRAREQEERDRRDE